MTEREVLKRVQLELSRSGCIVFRNNTGLVQDADGRHHRFGLCVGSSDIIGFRPIAITRAHVGQQIAQFCAIECKSDTGRLTPEQRNFLAMVEAAGGLAVVARNEEDIKNAIHE